MNAPGLRSYARRVTAFGEDSPLRSRRFVQMLFARAVSNVAVNALHYALLIAVVQQTGSAFHSSLIILTFTAPGVLVGMFAGVAVDHLSRRVILIAVHIVRAIACVAFFRFADNVWALYVISVLFSSANPFAGPAEYASLPGLVGAKRVTSGHAWFNLTSLTGQALGVGVIAPLFLKTVGAEPVYFLSAMLYAAAALLVLQMGRLSRAPQPFDGQREEGLADARAQFRQVWAFLRSDRPAYLATIEMAVVTTAVLVTVSLLPKYVDEVVGVSPDNAVFVFAPAVIGMTAGLRLVTPLSARAGGGVVVTGGFALLIASCLMLGFIEPVATLFTSWDLGAGTGDLPFPGPSSVVIATMVIAIPLGFSYTAVTVAARSVLHERTPERLHGRVFAMQGVLASLASVAPLLLGGALAELIGVRFVVVMLGVAAAAVMVYTRVADRPGPEPIMAVPG